MTTYWPIALLLLVITTGAADAADEFVVRQRTIADEKAVFATVESASVVPARARIMGTVVEVRVDEGDRVERGQVVAAVGDEKLALRIKALDAQIASLDAEARQLRANLERAESLYAAGTIPKVRRDEARTAADVAAGQLAARVADRQVARQEIAEGEVLAPAPGVVLAVPVTAGSVVLSGEPLSWIAEEKYVLRLRIPERHARFLEAGDAVRIDGGDISSTRSSQAVISLVYPRIEEGRVVADAMIGDLGDYFVGQRIRVWLSAGERVAYVVPAGFVVTRFGVDYLTLRIPGGGTANVPVQRGRVVALADIPDGIEILSGIADGDALVRP